MKSDELAAVEALTRRLPPAPPGETWIGDDAAVVRAPSGDLLLAAAAGEADSEREKQEQESRASHRCGL